MSHLRLLKSPHKPAQRVIAARLDADRKGLSPVGRISSPSLALCTSSTPRRLPS